MIRGVLVLNADYNPINVTSLQRGFNLVYKGKAEIVKSSDIPIVSSFGEFVRPLIIRLLNYVLIKTKKISKSIFLVLIYMFIQISNYILPQSF